jgi:ABC-type lipoprotein export system ATPase subunit
VERESCLPRARVPSGASKRVSVAGKTRHSGGRLTEGETGSRHVRLRGSGMQMPEGGQANIRREVGTVFQSFNLFPHRSVIENSMSAPVKARGVRKAEAHPSDSARFFEESARSLSGTKISRAIIGRSATTRIRVIWAKCLQRLQHVANRQQISNVLVDLVDHVRDLIDE